MRILIVSQYFWPEEFRINDVAKTLVEKGVAVDVLTGKPNYPSGRLFDGYQFCGVQHQNWNGINAYRIPLLVRGSGGVRLALNYLSFVIFGLLIAPWLFRKKKYDAIFIYGTSPILQAIPALFLGRLKKLPTVLWVQDLWPESLTATGYVRNNAIVAVVRSVVRWIYRNTSVLLVQSQAFVEPVRALAGSTPIKYYPNSVDASFAIPASGSMPGVFGMDAGFSVMFAGNIGSAQAVEVIVDAATRLKEHADIQFVVLGDGSSRAWMQQQAKERGLANLHLPGRFPVETMPAFMQKASALLVTLADREIFAATVPNKVQAYMAAGRPIIACLPGEGARLVSEAGAGIAVRAEDGAALAAAVMQLYRMTESEREVLGRKGRAYFHEHFDHEKLVDQLIAQLQAVAEINKGKQ